LHILILSVVSRVHYSIGSVLALSFGFRNSHLVPSFSCDLASLSNVLLADEFSTSVDKDVEFRESYAIIEVGVSLREGSEHFFEADVPVMVGINQAEETSGHTFLGKTLSGDLSASSAFIAPTFLVSCTFVAASFGSHLFLPSAYFSFPGSSSVCSEPTATMTIILKHIFVVEIDLARIKFIFTRFVVVFTFGVKFIGHIRHLHVFGHR